MKKILIILFVSVAIGNFTSICKAETTCEKIDVKVEKIDVSEGTPIPRSPMKMPDIYIADYALSFVNLWGGMFCKSFKMMWWSIPLLYLLEVPLLNSHLLYPVTLRYAWLLTPIITMDILHCNSIHQYK